MKELPSKEPVKFWQVYDYGWLVQGERVRTAHLKLPHGRNHLAARRLQCSSSLYSRKRREHSGEICSFVFVDQLHQFDVLKNLSFS